MTYATKLREHITRYAPADRPALIRFQREMFGADARQLDEEHFEWLFERNPYRRPGGPQMWVYRHNGEIVGQQGGIPFELKVGREYHRASWAIDLMVHPRWRLRGVGPALSETYVASNEITIGLGLSDSAYKAFLRAGWTDMGLIPLYVRPLDVRRMLEGRLPGRGRLHLLGSAATPLVRTADALCEAYARCRGVRIQLVDRFDEAVDALWAEVCDGCAVIARRDFRALRWRFDTLVNRDRYERLYLLRGDRLRGYAVVRSGMRHDAPVGVIIDYLCTPEWIRPLFARCVAYLRNAGAAAIYCTTLCRAAGKSMRTLGFIRRKSGLRLMIRPSEPSHPLCEMALNARNWFITTADSDGDHSIAEERGLRVGSSLGSSDEVANHGVKDG